MGKGEKKSYDQLNPPGWFLLRNPLDLQLSLSPQIQFVTGLCTFLCNSSQLETLERWFVDKRGIRYYHYLQLIWVFLHTHTPLNSRGRALGCSILLAPESGSANMHSGIVTPCMGLDISTESRLKRLPHIRGGFFQDPVAKWLSIRGGRECMEYSTADFLTAAFSPILSCYLHWRSLQFTCCNSSSRWPL